MGMNNSFINCSNVIFDILTTVHLIYHDTKENISKGWYVDIYLNFEKGKCV